MKILYSILLTLSFVLLLSGCNAELKLPKENLDKIHYTKTNMWFRDSHTHDGIEDNQIESMYSFYSVNYKYTKFIPINTPVKILRLAHNTVFIKIKKEIYAFNRTRQSRGKNLTQLFERTFSIEKTSLISYSPEIKKNILTGKVKKGMTKNEIILARGFPPETKTKSLINDSWFYWDTRRDRVKFDFDNDKLSRINYY